VNPYSDTPYAPAEHVCEPVNSAPGVATSLTWNDYLKKFMLVGIGSGHGLPRGIHFVLSDDLVNWSRHYLLREQPIVGSWKSPQRPTNYASIIDSHSSSDNFDISGSNPHLYFVRHGGHPNDDLIRVELEIRARCQDSSRGTFDVLGTSNGADSSVEFPGYCRPPGYRVTDVLLRASGTRVKTAQEIFLCRANRAMLYDFFIASDSNCEGHTLISSIGFVRTAGVDQLAIHLCQIDGGGEYFVSRDRRCKGQVHKSILGYSLETPSKSVHSIDEQ
jgi:hypothetical protein